MYKTVFNGSMAHTVGNVTSLFTEMIKSLFPNNYFRHTHINTRMAYREQKREENSNYEFIKKNRPILIVRPKIDIDNTDIFMTYSMLTNNIWGMDFLNTDGQNFFPFYRDRDKMCEVKYLLNRIRVILECSVVVDTEYEQINQYVYISQFTPDRINRMNSALEVYIPPSVMELISAYSGVPIKDPDTGTVKPFLDYTMNHANKYITFKERTSSSTHDFFMYYPLSIDWVLHDLSKDDPNKKSWAMQSATINFSITAEFNTPTIYTFSAMKKNPIIIGAQMDFGKKNDDPKNLVNIVPYFTIPNLFDSENMKLDNGFEMFYTQGFETDINKNKQPDELDIAPVFANTNCAEIIDWHNKNGIPNTVFIRFIIMKNNKMLVEGTDYSINWNTQKITILESDPDVMYTLTIFVNNLYVTDLLENYNGLSNTYEQQVYPTTNKIVRTKKDDQVGVK